MTITIETSAANIEELKKECKAYLAQFGLYIITRPELNDNNDSTKGVKATHYHIAYRRKCPKTWSIDGAEEKEVGSKNWDFFLNTVFAEIKVIDWAPIVAAYDAKYDAEIAEAESTSMEDFEKIITESQGFDYWVNRKRFSMEFLSTQVKEDNNLREILFNQHFDLGFFQSHYDHFMKPMDEYRELFEMNCYISDDDKMEMLQFHKRAKVLAK